MLITATDGIEIEELTNAVQHVLLFQIADLFLTRRSKLAIEGIHRLVADDGATRQRLTEHHAFQSLATAQRHVGLTMGKAMGSIDDGMFKGKALTLVDGYRPRQSERILAEPSFHAFLNLLGFLVQGIFRIGPLHLFQFKILIGILAAHGNLVANDGAHLANHTIIETVLRIVLDKHHLRSRFQDELEISRIRRFRKIAFHLCRKGIRLRRKGSKLLLVDILCRSIMGGKTDIVALLRRFEVRDISLVQSLQRSFGSLVLPNLIKKRDKLLVLLTIHLFEFDGKIARLLQGIAAEEERGIIILPYQLLFLRGNHRSKLMQIAYHEKLNASERQVVALAILTQYGIDGIEQIAAHHTDFVDDKQVDASDDVTFQITEFIAFLFATTEGRTWHVWRKRKLEERMDGHSSSVDGSDARRSQHHHAFRRQFFQSLEEGRLTCARLSRKEKVGTCLFYNVPCQDGFFVHFHITSFKNARFPLLSRSSPCASSRHEDNHRQYDR